MTDNWDSYLCEVDGRPASILVDLGAVAQAPIQRFPYLGYVTITLRDPDDNGFPRREESEMLSVLEDTLEAALTVSDAAVHIGRCITGGRYGLIFYTIGTEDWNSRVSVIMDSLPPYEWDTGAQYEPGWDTYLGFLFPGVHDLLSIQNRRLCRRLQEEGDDLSRARLISHWLDFLDPESGKAFCLAVQSIGFLAEAVEAEPGLRDIASAARSGDHTVRLGEGLQVAHASVGRPGADSYPFQVRLSRIDTPEEMDEISVMLLELAEVYGGVYQGWSCPVSGDR